MNLPYHQSLLAAPRRMLSAALDTVIGVAFMFFLLSTACSAATEGIATLLRKRGDYLYRGLRQLLDGSAQGAEAGPAHWIRPCIAATLCRLGTKWPRLHPMVGPPAPSAFDFVVAHPLVAAQHRIRRSGLGRPPSYLSAATVATAVLDGVVPAAAGRQNPAELIAAIRSTGDLRPHLQKSLLALASIAEKGTPDFMTAIERWYDDHMARISGQYKRWTKKWLLVVAAVIVLVVHIDVLALTSTLWTNPSVRSATVALASPTACDASKPNTVRTDGPTSTAADYAACLREQTAALTDAGAPIGPLSSCALSHPLACVFPEGKGTAPAPDPGGVIIGLVLSVLAAGFGAPFWFDVLTKAGSLRNTGTKPAPAG